MRYGTISRVPSTVAQRQSNRLLTDGSLVRIQSVELKLQYLGQEIASLVDNLPREVLLVALL